MYLMYCIYTPKSWDVMSITHAFNAPWIPLVQAHWSFAPLKSWNILKHMAKPSHFAISMSPSHAPIKPSHDLTSPPEHRAVHWASARSHRREPGKCWPGRPGPGLSSSMIEIAGTLQTLISKVRNVDIIYIYMCVLYIYIFVCKWK